MQNEEYNRMFKTEEHLWWYTGLRDFVKTELKQFSGAGKLEILDVGCGTGINLKLLGEFGETTGIDFAPEALRFCRQRGFIKTARASMIQLPFSDESFDIVSCMDVLGHSWIPDDQAALVELRRVLKPGGIVMLHVAAMEALRGQHDEVIMFSRRYSASQLRHTITAAGLEVQRVTYRYMASLPLLLLHRRISRLRRSGQAEANSDVQMPNPVINKIMGAVIRLENHVATRIRLPIGSSLYCLARRPADK